MPPSARRHEHGWGKGLAAGTDRSSIPPARGRLMEVQLTARSASGRRSPVPPGRRSRPLRVLRPRWSGRFPGPAHWRLGRRRRARSSPAWSERWPSDPANNAAPIPPPIRVEPTIDTARMAFRIGDMFGVFSLSTEPDAFGPNVSIGSPHQAALSQAWEFPPSQRQTVCAADHQPWQSPPGRGYRTSHGLKRRITMNIGPSLAAFWSISVTIVHLIDQKCCRRGPAVPCHRPSRPAGQQSASDRAVARAVQRAARAAGLDPNRYAGHSLRAGLATSAAAAGASERSIMAQTGHTSLPMVPRYIRDGSLFTDNEAATVGL